MASRKRWTVGRGSWARPRSVPEKRPGCSRSSRSRWVHEMWYASFPQLPLLALDLCPPLCLSFRRGGRRWLLVGWIELRSALPWAS